MLIAHVDWHSIRKCRYLRLNYFHLLRGSGRPRFGYKLRFWRMHVLIITSSCSSSGLCTLFLFFFRDLELIIFQLEDEAVVGHNEAFALNELKCLATAPSILPDQVRHDHSRRSANARSAVNQNRPVPASLLYKLIGLFENFQKILAFVVVNLNLLVDKSAWVLVWDLFRDVENMCDFVLC